MLQKVNAMIFSYLFTLNLSFTYKNSNLLFLGQWGMPTFNIGPALGIIAGVLASAIESVGDYLACARLAGAPIPPVHAINRGIMVEGFGCIISGFCGTASGLTSFSQNVGAIAITKVCSSEFLVLFKSQDLFVYFFLFQLWVYVNKLISKKD